jgi:parallel beta-helix repeat protein
MLTLILVGTLASTWTIKQATGNKWIVGPDSDFASIQEAINYENVSDGDTIEVRWKPTPYYENVTVNKSLIIVVYEDDRIRGDYPTVDGGNKEGVVFNVIVDKVVIDGFVIRNGEYGIKLASSNNTITNNNVTSNTYGVYIEGVNNTLSNNRIRGNSWNFGADGGVQYIDYSNTVEYGKPIYYWVDRHDELIQSSAGYVALVGCTNINVTYLQLRRNIQGIIVVASKDIILQNLDIRDNSDDGVLFNGTSNSRIENVSIITRSYENRAGVSDIRFISSSNNSVCNNTLLHYGYVGIELRGYSQNNSVNDNIMQNIYPSEIGTGMQLIFSNDNVIAGNTLSHNAEGISLFGSDSNILYHNNFINNTDAASCMSGSNFWNLTREGNYWGNDITVYPKVDENRDGINDEPCNKTINNYNIDYHPLNETWISTRQIDVTYCLNDSLAVRRMTPIPPPDEISIQSDHVVASYQEGYAMNWSEQKGVITFNITASTPGFCNVTIPRNILDTEFELFINGTLTDYDFTCNANYSSICFPLNYDEGIYNVVIIGYRVGSIYGDVNHDGKVDLADITTILDNFGEYWKK